MAVGTTLGELLAMVREEAGLSASASTGRNVVESLKRGIRRNYRRLHAAHDWPHLRVRRSEALKHGERYYSFPADLDFNRVEAVELLPVDGGRWRALCYGIDAALYNRINSDRGATGDYPRHWQVYENRQYEVWPVPSHDGDRLRLTGIAEPAALTADAERMDLDDDMVVLYTAAEWLARQKSPDAEIKLQQAADFYNTLRANQGKWGAIAHEAARDRHAWPGVHVHAPGYDS